MGTAKQRAKTGHAWGEEGNAHNVARAVGSGRAGLRDGGTRLIGHLTFMKQIRLRHARQRAQRSSYVHPHLSRPPKCSLRGEPRLRLRKAHCAFGIAKWLPSLLVLSMTEQLDSAFARLVHVSLDDQFNSAAPHITNSK